MGAHADKELSFEVESTRYSSRTRSVSTADQSGVRPATSPVGIESPALGSRLPNHAGSDVESPKVETVPHIVERGENFWTISRLYYSSERYYRALWKANDRKYPRIDILHINDVIIIPPVEDLDPAFIDPPRSQTARAGIEGTGRAMPAAVPSDSGGRRDSLSTARTTRTSGSSSTNTRRTARSDAVLNLPTEEAALPRDHGIGSGGDPADAATVDDGAESLVIGRPRIPAKVNRPSYKVRRYDTLRSIARNALGDPRRDKEILSLNRDIIDDPANLIPGQFLELPEDADTRRITTRVRN